MMNHYFFKCHKYDTMITFELCNIFKRIWYSESILGVLELRDQGQVLHFAPLISCMKINGADT